MLSHARSENKLFKNLIYDEVSFRSVAKSWFENSSFKYTYEIFIN